MGYTAVIDYGVGNLHSVTNAMDYIGLKTLITNDPKEIEGADSILLPGVGAFPDAFRQLERHNLVELLRREGRKKPTLGICLGMQLLFERGTEVRECEGLGLIEGSVERIVTDRKLPHIGWNDLRYPNPCPLFRGIPEGEYVYFVHSYCALPKDPKTVAAVTEYGTEVCAAVASGTVFGCQFHPEKSGETGLAILRNFGELK